MRGIYTPVTDIRRKVFTEVARMAYEVNELSDYEKLMRELPFKIIPGEEKSLRSSIFLERAIISERVRLAMGMSLRPLDESVPASEGLEHSVIADKYYEPPLINVIKFACNACPEKVIKVTAMCQGCLAHPCQEVCPKHAISFRNGKSHIDQSLCVKCGRCVKVCAEVQGCAALTYSGRSAGFKVTTAFDLPMDQTDCVLCGQCSLVCPVGAIVETDYTNEVTAAIQDSSKHVIVQVAPSVRVGLGDEFGMEAGAVVTGKMVTALRMLGFDKVFDTNFSADLTIMEEGSELLKRIREGGKLPMITSCSPGWVTYLEKHHPELIDHLSTAKSPQAMFGAVAKTYYAQKMGWDPHDVVSVSVMPCTAKKYEASRPELGRDGYQDVDYVLTTRELAKLIRYVGLDLSVLPESEFDSPLGTGSGAGAIFGATGGVMEAALRTAYELYTGKTLPRLEFDAVRGDINAIKEATIDLDGTPLKVAVANGLKNAEELIRRVERGEADYIFIEIMACPGGCIGGGGQPIGTNNAVRDARIQALYEIDRSLPLRKSHENPEIKTIYEEFFGAPLSQRSHELLHTHYHARKKRHDFSHLN